MVRTYKQLAILAGGTPQPLMFTKTTAALASSVNPISIPVGDTTFLRQGDYVIIGSVLGGDEERHIVRKIIDATHFQTNSLALNHLSGVYVRLSILVQSAYVQSVAANAALLFVGTQNLNVAGGNVGVIASIGFVASGQLPDWSDIRRSAPNGIDAGDYWIDGTTADKYQASFGVV